MWFQVSHPQHPCHHLQQHWILVMMLMLVVRCVALYCISIVTNPPLVSRPVPLQVPLEVAALDFQAFQVGNSRRGLEVKTITIQRDLLALILPLGMRRDIRTSQLNRLACK